jgi:hypothetical protein
MTLFYPTELSQGLEVGLSVTITGYPTIMRPERGRSFTRGGNASDPMILEGAQTMAQPWELLRFQRFWREDTRFGSLPFWMPDQQFDDEPLLMPDHFQVITMPNGTEINNTAWWLCQFVGRPSEPSIEFNLWRITFPLEVIS